MTSLFVNNTDVLLEDDPSVTPVVVDCTTYVREQLDKDVVYFYHPVFGDPTVTTWPRHTEICCLHCCDSFDTTPIPTVRRFDEVRNIYHVYGIYCSVNCAKRALMETEPNLSTTRLLYFNHMCRNVFGIHEATKPAPPKIRLRRFGGDLTIEEFRKDFIMGECVVLEPPFVQSSLMCAGDPGGAKRSMNNSILTTGRDHDAKSSGMHDRGIYAEYLLQKPDVVSIAPKEKSVNTAVSFSKKSRKRKISSVENGSLDAFLSFPSKN